jgi:hypothetical protein
MRQYRKISLVLVSAFLWNGSQMCAQQEARPTLDEIESELVSLRTAIADQQKVIATQQELIESQRQELLRVEGLFTPKVKTKSSLDNTVSADSAVREATSQKPMTPEAPRQETRNTISRTAPLAIRLGNLDFKPVGFADLSSIFRSTNVGSGSGTAFGSIPFNNGVAGQLTEERLSAQNSRIGVRMDGQALRAQLLAYVEADFVGGQALDAVATRNSSPLNLRLFFFRAQRDKWDVTVGQAWSLLTPNRRGLSTLPSELFYTLSLDTNYQVGLLWSRTPQLRFVYRPNSSVSIGGSIENTSQYVGSYVVFPANTPPGYFGQLDTGSLSTAVPALTPDFLSKVAVDQRWLGKQVHAEIGDVLRTFKVVHPLFGHIDTKVGFGFVANLDVEVARGFHLITANAVGRGIGRSVGGLAPDVVVRGDGTLSPVSVHSTLDGVEYRVSRSVLLFGYYGGVFTNRNTSVFNGQQIGFGVPLPSDPTQLQPGHLLANRSVQEGTGGISRTIWSDPRYGAVLWNSQVSWVSRQAWATNRPAHVLMVFTNMRFIFP